VAQGVNPEFKPQSTKKKKKSHHDEVEFILVMRNCFVNLKAITMTSYRIKDKT
jgi:hypothetical protein